MTPDVLVLGAGPAGSVVARRLAAAGVRVTLVGSASPAGWEGLSARSIALLAEEGIGSSDVVGRPVARLGVWAGGRTVEGMEWLTERRVLAAALRAHAAAAGVDVRHDSMTSVERSDGIWRGHRHTGGTLAAPLLIDARGRRGAERRGPVLLAVGRRFLTTSRGAPGTQIHAADFGWCWWAAHAGALWVQVVGRPQTAHSMAAHPEGWLAAAAAQIPALARALDGAAPDGGASAKPAHARLGFPAQDPTRWRVGDAALALDPLSGQGVYEALRGARLVATAVQSVLAGGNAAAAHRFVAERHEESWASGVRTAAGLYRENAGRSAFWAQTAAAYEHLAPEAAAFAPRIEYRPVLCDGRIQEREVIVTPQNPGGVWHVADVPLVSLKGYLDCAENATITGASAALDRPPAAVASAIHWLQQTGMVARRIRPSVPSGG